MPHRCVRRKCQFRRSSASSLTDSLRSVVRLRRAVSTHSKAIIRLSTESGDNAGKNMCAKKQKATPLAFFHRLRPPDEHHKIDAQVRGGETRQDYKDTRRFPLEAPSCALLFRPCRLPDTCPPFSLREAWRFLIAHAVGISARCRSFAPSWAVCTNPPVQPDRCALSGNYRLESNPVRHDLTPLAAATGNRISRAMMAQMVLQSS